MVTESMQSMIMIRRIATILMIVFFVQSVDFIHSPQAAPPFNVDNAVTKIFPRQGTRIWHEDDGIKAEWRPEEHGYPCFFEFYKGEPVISTILYTSVVPHSGDKETLVVYCSAPPDYECHACAPMVGIAHFTYDNGAWNVTANQPNITEIGSYGKVAPNDVVSLGPHAWGVAFYPDYMAQGYYNQHLVLIAPNGSGGFAEVALIHLIDDPTGSGFEYDVKFESSVDIDSSRVIEERYPIRIHRTVDLSDDDGGYETKKYTVEYVWSRENGYKPVADSSIEAIENRLQPQE